MFYAPGFDPVLIVAQIVCLQCALYLDLGLWLSILTALTGNALTRVSLSSLFSYSAIRLSFAGGWIPLVAYILNAVVGAVVLALIVERAKKCLDFTTTFHFVHLLCCWWHGGFPSSWEWWGINLGSLCIMALLGEYLCMKRELQDIPLFGGKGGTGVEYRRVLERRHSGESAV
mmetsp:Transcript_2244/g.6803  ORF Transcript_2244/g.6803 Transcript_2244/m.6803 type:complete len:173 (-) Transcript_2244:324-842(-)